MRNLKKFLALVLAMMMAFSLMVTVNAASSTEFSAGVDDKYTEAVDVLYGMGVLRGDSGGFRPTSTITRAEVAAILYRVMTADVTDRQAGIYSDYDRFYDVTSEHWYAGYINLMYDWGKVKGYSNVGDGTDTFGPNDPVTGYHVLVMFLRAIGYGQNGEFEDSQWQIRAASLANQLGITQNIDTGTLGQYAERQVVAEMIFRAIQVPTVEYTMLSNYQQQWINTTNNVIGTQSAARNTPYSLGFKNFGLEYRYGIVVGNQATGEDNTKITGALVNEDVDTFGDAYYGYDNSGDYKFETGLDMFGHAAKVWYDRTSGATPKAYAVIDKATKVDVVLSSSQDLSSTNAGTMGKAAKDAGFKVAAAGAYKSNAYATIDAAASGSRNTTADTSNPGIYCMISNSTDKTLDVVIAVDALVARIDAKNTTAKDQTLTLTGSSYGNSDVIYLDAILEGSTTDLGEVVIAQKITGTNQASISSANADTLPYSHLDRVYRTVTGRVTKYEGTTVTLDTGVVLQQSPLYGQVKNGCITQTTPNTNQTYTFTLDNTGEKYLGARLASDMTFVYGTYADFQDPNLGDSNIKYYIFGVGIDGSIIPATQIKKVDGADIDGGKYNGLGVVHKSFGDSNGNQIVTTGKAYTAYTIDPNGNLVTASGDLSTNLGILGITPAGATDWTITAGDAALGYVSVNSNALFLTENTKFIVVDGNGNDTEVEIFNGISDLLGDAGQVVIDPDDTTVGLVYYTASPYVYNSITGITTQQVNTVILPKDVLTYTNSSASLFYCGADATAGVTDTKTSAVAYDLYNMAGEEVTLYIESASISTNTFYTLTETGNTTNDGQKTYTAAALADDDVAGSLQVKWGNGSGKQYLNTGNTNNLDTAVIGGSLYNVTNAIVVDTTGDSTINAIDSIAKLNAAVSSGAYSTVDVDFVITNGTSNVIIIFVTAVTV